MGELDRNFMTMQTSSGEELNIIGERCMAELTWKYTSIKYHNLYPDGAKPCLEISNLCFDWVVNNNDITVI